MNISEERMQAWLEKSTAEIEENLSKLGVTFSSRKVRYRLFLSGHSNQLLTQDLALHYLNRDGRFPAVIDIAPCAIIEHELIVAVMPSGHPWVSEEERTWGGHDRGPFKVCPWSLPGSLLTAALPTAKEFVENGKLILRSIG
jgi:hypothetical protein